MSDEEFGKYDSLDDLSFSNEKDSSSNLDEYGVWVKKSPNLPDNTPSSKERAETGDVMDEHNIISDEEHNDSEGEAFDFDGLSEEVSMQDDKSDGSNVEKREGDDPSFDNIDMSDFFTDFDSDASKEEEAKEEEMTLKMDLNFDNVDSYDEDATKDNFDAMLDDAVSLGSSEDFISAQDVVSSSEDEIDDLLSSSTSPPSFTSQDDSVYSDIPLDVSVDEAQDFTKLSSEEDDDSLVISPPIFKKEESKPKPPEMDSVVIKNTVIEPENIEEIKKENKKILGEDNMKENVVSSKDSLIDNALQESVEFSDVDALAKDLTDDEARDASLSSSAHIAGSIEVKKVESVLHVEGVDKLAELLSSILQELTSVKKEIAFLKVTLSKSTEDGKTNASFNSIVDEKEEDATGFFEDEDTDEAIALTGDELNNILITADFTEEDTNDADEKNNKEEKAPLTVDSTAEGDASFGECEVCDDENSFDDEFDFDNIALENAKLDDFVIPEELDYNMLRSENGEEDSQGDSVAIKTEGEDMSYLDEKDVETSIEENVANVPQTQKLPASSKEEVSSDAVFSSDDVLPSNIKKDIKSVLSYMDQLLESLPEDKMKEFAESEYFEMYNRLFSELGIS